MKRVLIAGGGTGGHLFPGIAVADELRRRFATEVRFVGSEHGIERYAVPRAGYSVDLLPVRGLRREGLRGWMRTAWLVPKSTWAAARLLRQFQPEMVIGVGGYASFPAGLAAVLLRVPLVLLEQNAIPGVTTRLLAPAARLVCASMDASKAHFRWSRVVVTGNPIRLFGASASPRAIDASAGSSPVSMLARPFRLLVFGGSAGAHRLNLIVPEALAQVGGELEIVHQTGTADREAVEQAYLRLGLVAEVRAFIEDMGRAYSRADLVICRAGATTIAELTALGIAAVFVPFPFAAGDHQRLNAQALVDQQAAWMILDRDLNRDGLASRIQSVLADRDELARRGARMRAIGRPDAAARVVDECLAAL